MNRLVEVVALVEGQTEKIFIQKLLRPHLEPKNVYVTPIILTKPGQKGGDVRFSRAGKDIEHHLKQRKGTWLTLLVDYYGIKGDWPGYEASKRATQHTVKARVMNEATQKQVNELFEDQDSQRRFIPYVSMFEFEALLFSDAKILTRKLNVPKHHVEKILSQYGERRRSTTIPRPPHPNGWKPCLTDSKKPRPVSALLGRLASQECERHARSSTNG